MPTSTSSSTAPGSRRRAARRSPVLNPATGEPIGTVAHAEKADLDLALAAAQKGFATWRKVSALRPLSADAQGRRHPAQPRQRHRDADDHGAGQAARRSQGRDAGRRRRDRLVRRGSAPHLWPHRAGARRRRLPDRSEGAGRPGRGVHAVEFPDQPGGAQGVLRDRGRLLDHPQGPGGDAGRLRRPRRCLRRRPAFRRASSTSCSACRRRFPPISFRIRSSARSRSRARPRSASSLRRSPAPT